jgi:hypothetical protein
MCHIPCHYVRYYVFISLHSGGYGWQYFRCYLDLCHCIHTMYPFRHIAFTSCTQLSHLPQFILFVLGAAMRVHLVRTAIFVPHVTSVRTICPAAPCEFLLAYITTSGGLFLVAWSSSRLYHLIPCVRTSQLINRA